MIERLNSPQLKLIILLICLLLTVSCRKENVCTLTPEQFPALRGFKLGMSYETVVKRFPEICVPYIEANKMMVIRLGLYNHENKTYDTPHSDFYINPESNADLDGISRIELTFSNKRLNKYEISYKTSDDADFGSAFEDKTLKALNLSDWTNWQIYSSSETFESSGRDGSESEKYSRSIHQRRLLCNQMAISIETQQNSPVDANVRVKKGVVNFATLEVSATDAQALSETEKSEREKQQEAQEQAERDKYLKKQAEEKNKTESFKP